MNHALPFTPKQLFIKTFIWALIGSTVFVAIFLFIVSVTNIFRGNDGAGKFVDGILFSSIIGNILGAGLVGWRVVDKYRHHKTSYWLRRYSYLSLLSILLCVGVLYTPITGVLALWGVVSSLLVQVAMSNRRLWPHAKRKNISK